MTIVDAQLHIWAADTQWISPASSVRSRFPFPDLHDPSRQLFDAYSPKRTFWGTDLRRMPCYERIHLFTDHMPWLTDEDMEWVLGRGGCEWLDWPL